MSDKIIIGCDTCNGEEELFCEWLIEHGYDAEVSNSTGQGIGSEEQNQLWDQYCGDPRDVTEERSDKYDN